MKETLRSSFNPSAPDALVSFYTASSNILMNDRPDADKNI